MMNVRSAAIKYKMNMPTHVNGTFHLLQIQYTNNVLRALNGVCRDCGFHVCELPFVRGVSTQQSMKKETKKAVGVF